MSYCCPLCFDNDFVANFISNKSSRRGTCDYCGASDQALIPADSLALYFEPVYELYEESIRVGSSPLGVCLTKHWRIFNNTLDLRTKEHLLSEILLRNVTGKSFFLQRKKSISQAQRKWDAFSEELKSQNRFTVREEFESTLKGIRFLLRRLQQNIPVRELYRARVNRSTQKYKAEEMLKPPAEKTVNGRANPPGISYLYTATSPKVAIHEIRPHVKASVSVAKLKVKDSINAKIIDLRFPHPPISPFIFDTGDDDDLEIMTANLSFIEILGRELSKPISPDLAHLDYLPSQYLCEFIKKEGYDGIAYKSAICPRDRCGGYNIVLFNDNIIDSDISVDTYSVTSHHIKSRLE